MKNIIDLSQKLIRIESTADNKNGLYEVLEIAKKELKQFSVRTFEKNSTPSLLFSNIKNAKDFKILLNAHLDVIPGLKNQYKPLLKNGKLYGRGAQDMKAAASCEILVFKELVNKVNYPLGLQLVTDEEIGGFNSAKYQIEKGIKADFVIAGEPTEFGINNEAKGIVWIKIIAKGKSSHGAYPWKGENAITKMISFLNILQKKYPVPSKESWTTTVNVSQISTSNKTTNKVPDNCEVVLDVRYVPLESEKIVKNVTSLIPKSFGYQILLKEPSQFTSENSKYIKLLKTETEKIIRRNVKTVYKHGGSDVRHFNQIGCEGITFGPIGDGMHTDNEWVSIKSLNHYYQILTKFLLSI